MYRHILVPTDGSPLSARAIKEAVKFARSSGAKITGFYAAPEFRLPVYGDYIPPQAFNTGEFQRHTREVADKHLEAIERAARAAGVRCKCVYVANDRPAEAIIEAAKKHRCDLIFMASHGRRGLQGLLLGSETMKVLTHSKTPVLVHR